MNNLHPLIKRAALGLLALPLFMLSNIAQANDFPTAAPEEVGVSSDRLQRLSNTMQRYIDSNMLAGTVSLVSRNGKVIHVESQGWKNKETGEQMTDDSIFVIMSMTKPIVSAALMMLYEEGHFLLTDPITDWIPELEGKQVVIEENGVNYRMSAHRPITFRHVLSHTAGVDPSREVLTEEELALLPRKATLEETLINRASLPLSFHPGDDWQYGSSTDYVALLVERISGLPLVDFLQEKILNPLQMHDTS